MGLKKFRLPSLRDKLEMSELDRKLDELAQVAPLDSEEVEKKVVIKKTKNQ